MKKLLIVIVFLMCLIGCGYQCIRVFPFNEAHAESIPASNWITEISSPYPYHGALYIINIKKEMREVITMRCSGIGCKGDYCLGQTCEIDKYEDTTYSIGTLDGEIIYTVTKSRKME